MEFASIRMISDDLEPVVSFYEEVTGVTAVWPAPVFAEVQLPSCTITFGHTKTAQLFNNSARPADNHSVIIEFRVDDVDTEFQRLKSLVSEWVQEPTTMPWGIAPSCSATPTATSSICLPPSPTKRSRGSVGRQRERQLLPDS